MTTDQIAERSIDEAVNSSLRVLAVGDSYDRLSAIRDALGTAVIECEIHCPGIRGPISDATRSSTVCLLVANENTDLTAEVRRLRAMNPQIPILVTGSPSGSTHFLDLIEAGAVGCVSIENGVDANRLREMLEAAAHGEAVVPRGLVRLLVDDVWQRSRRQQLAKLGLTHREEEILLLLLDRTTTKEMAERFYVSAVTIRTHLSAIYRKLGVSDRRGVIELLQPNG